MGASSTTEATLEAFFAERPRDAARALLDRAVAAHFNLLPLHRQNVERTIDGFLRVRGLGLAL